MAVKKLDSGRVVLSNAAYLHVTPWTSEDAIGATSYDLVNIVGDTLSFTPDDNTINSKEGEFQDTPLFENILLGKTQFAANCIDFQNDVLKSMFGWKAIGENGSMVAPTSYKDLFVTLEVGFKNEDVVVVVPKLKLNSKLIISTLKTGTAEGNLAGTAYNEEIAIGGTTETTSMAMINKKDTSYTITSKKTAFTTGDGLTGA